jgi:hypothetical protein
LASDLLSRPLTYLHIASAFYFSSWPLTFFIAPWPQTFIMASDLSL